MDRNVTSLDWSRAMRARPQPRKQIALNVFRVLLAALVGLLAGAIVMLLLFGCSAHSSQPHGQPGQAGSISASDDTRQEPPIEHDASVQQAIAARPQAPDASVPRAAQNDPVPAIDPADEDAGSVVRAGSMTDAGHAIADAGSQRPDAAPVADAGERDAGAPADAAIEVPDAGHDAGELCQDPNGPGKVPCPPFCKDAGALVASCPNHCANVCDGSAGWTIQQSTCCEPLCRC